MNHAPILSETRLVIADHISTAMITERRIRDLGVMVGEVNTHVPCSLWSIRSRYHHKWGFEDGA
jgi:hypothetical protein